VLKFSDQPKRISSHILCRRLWAFPRVCLAILGGKSRNKRLEHFYRFQLQQLPLCCSHAKLSGLHVPFQHGHMSPDNVFHRVMSRAFSFERSCLGIQNLTIDKVQLQVIRSEQVQASGSSQDCQILEKYIIVFRSRLRFKQISQKARQIQHQNFHLVARHIISIVLLDVHVENMCCMFRG
jgi:hypothetical protein